LLRFCPETAARLAAVAESSEPGSHPLPAIDLYQHFTRTLTGQWSPGDGDPPVLHRLARALQGLPFWCALVSGDFTHVGTTTLFRDLITGRTDFAGLYAVHQRLGAADMAGVISAGVVVDSVLFPGSEIGPGAVVIECHFDVPVRLARGAVAHGLESLDEPVEIPEDTVVHQLPILLPDGRRGVSVRVYGVADDPKAPADSAAATWLGRPILDEVRSLGLDLLAVWPALPREQWTLWNAALFPVAPPADAWACARWLMRVSDGFDAQRWARFERVSLAAGAQWADGAALAVSQARRLQANWVSAAVALAASESDLRPLLASAPGLCALTHTARRLLVQARSLEESAPVTAASRHFQAGLFFAQAGLENDAGEARQRAFALVSRGVALGTPPHRPAGAGAWKHSLASAAAPARVDLGGGWSDTPPFCLDWGGAVLNLAVAFSDEHPIRTLARTLSVPVIRFVSAEDAQTVEYRRAADLLQPAGPGDPFSIHRCALQLSGLFDDAADLTAVLERLGGGLELRTEVNLPMGSGLGTSSILAATVLRALAGLRGLPLTPQQLSDDVMVLEQRMSTGGGWQDQAGGIFPGAKLVTSGPGLRQRLRVQPVAWTREREAEFESLTLLYYTGIRRIARDLLQQVVGGYLARESAAFQVLHSIKTLAMEMACAMSEGDWDYLGSLLDRHWALNQLLDPNTTNAPINALLRMVRPYIRGAKLAGAGGGGFLILLSKGPTERDQLHALLADYGKETGGALYDWRIARDGLRAEPSELGD